MWNFRGEPGNTVLSFAIDSYNTHGLEDIEVIGLIWQNADQRTRDFLCSKEYKLIRDGSVSAINILRNMQEKERTNDSNKAALEEVIQEMEEHKRVMDFDSNLRKAIQSLEVNQVEKALGNCGTDAAMVLERKVYCDNTRNVDALLVFPLKVKYSKELNQEDVEKIKEIFKLMFAAASPRLLRYALDENNYVMSKLVEAQELFATIPGVGKQCFQDLIQKFEEELSKDTLDNAKTDDQIAWDKAYEIQFSQEINHDLFENDDTDPGQNPVINTANPELTNEADNKTPEKNDTTFWSEHKGKIALGVTGLCVAGAVAAYVLAYPVVALVLAALATAILVGAGIAKVLEDPSVEKPFTSQQEVHH